MVLQGPTLAAECLLPCVHARTPPLLGPRFHPYEVKGGPGGAPAPSCPSGQALSPTGEAADELETPSRTECSQGGKQGEGFARQLLQQVPLPWIKGKGCHLKFPFEVGCGFFLRPFFSAWARCTPSS